MCSLRGDVMVKRMASSTRTQLVTTLLRYTSVMQGLDDIIFILCYVVK